MFLSKVFPLHDSDDKSKQSQDETNRDESYVHFVEDEMILSSGLIAGMRLRVVMIGWRSEPEARR